MMEKMRCVKKTLLVFQREHYSRHWKRKKRRRSATKIKLASSHASLARFSSYYIKWVLHENTQQARIKENEKEARKQPTEMREKKKLEEKTLFFSVRCSDDQK